MGESGRSEHERGSGGGLLVECRRAGSNRLQRALSVKNLAFILQAVGELV